MQFAKFALALVPSLSSTKLPPVPVSAPYTPSVEALNESLEVAPLSILEELSFPEVDPLTLQKTEKAELVLELKGLGVRERKEGRDKIVTVVKKVTDWSKEDRAKVASAFKKDEIKETDPKKKSEIEEQERRKEALKLAAIADNYSGSLQLGVAHTPEVEALHLQAYVNLNVLHQLGVYSGLTNDQIAAMAVHCFFETRFGVEPKKGAVGFSALPEKARVSIEKRMIREFKDDEIKWKDLSVPVQEALIMIELYVRGTERFESVQGREPRVDEMVDSVFRFMALEAYYLERSGAKKEFENAHLKIQNKKNQISRYVEKSKKRDLSDKDKKKLKGYREDLAGLEDDLQELNNKEGDFRALFLERSGKSEFDAFGRLNKYAPMGVVRSTITAR